MNKDFDFNQVGKRMPYRVPEHFFENVQADMLRRTDEERNKKKARRMKVWVVSVLAAAAVFCGVCFLPKTPSEDESPFTAGAQLAATDFMDVYVRQLSDEELQNWIEFSENDIYYELATEDDDYENN